MYSLHPAVKRHLRKPWVLPTLVHVLATVIVVALGGESLLFAGSLFSDVPSSHPHSAAISWLQDKGYIRGYPDGTFAPNDTMNRAEFLHLLIQAAGLEGDAVNCLKDFREAYGSKARLLQDVTPGDWYEADVCQALTQNIVKGYADHTFGAENRVSFAEGAVMLTRAYGFSVPPESGQEWYEPAVRGLADRQAIPTDTVSFHAPLSRALVAEMIYRIDSWTTDLPSLTYELLKAQGEMHAAASAENPVQAMLASINAVRWQNGLAPVRENLALQQAAQMYANDLKKYDYFSHTGRDGSSPPDRMIAAGYSTPIEGCGCKSISYHYGEVIGQAPTPDDVLAGFLGSPAHRPIILSSDLDEVGVGQVDDLYVVEFAQTLVEY